MRQDNVILRFNKVFFEFEDKNPILDEADFSVRQGSKITLMGQNGAGKSTIFEIIRGTLQPKGGRVSLDQNTTIGMARQVIPEDQMDLTIREFFEKAFNKKIYDIDPRINKVLDVVHLKSPLTKYMKTFSGGEQARLLLAFALIQNPDLLLLDEPTNNLDKTGIEHLQKFLIDYKKTCIVISHDADFLNSFTQGVLYLDIFTHKVEQYAGDYFKVVEEISRRIERERMKNVRLERDIQNRKEQANFFAQKGGHMRDVARKMREKIDKLQEEKVDLRQEDKTIKTFHIPSQHDVTGEILHITSLPIIKSGKTVNKKFNLSIKKGVHIHLRGPNGIGKTTLLESLYKREIKGISIAPNVHIGYYRQDFRTLDFNQTVYKSLTDVARDGSEETIRGVAAGFLIGPDLMKTKIRDLSYGQKGLLSFARLVLERPGLLILDEPTNHMNFRHIPVIAAALDKYDGAMILVSHVPEFVKQIRIDEVMDLEKLGN